VPAQMLSRAYCLVYRSRVDRSAFERVRFSSSRMVVLRTTFSIVRCEAIASRAAEHRIGQTYSPWNSIWPSLTQRFSLIAIPSASTAV
jgi:hypothetical protein